MRPKRILFAELNTDNTVGGSHTCLLDLLEHIDRTKFEPYVLFYQDNSLVSKFAALAKIIIVPPPMPLLLPDGVRRLPKPVAAVFTLMAKVVNANRLIARPAAMHWRVLRQHRIELVHLNNAIHIGLDWLLAARFAGVRCIAHQRGFGVHARVPFARRFDKIVCMSDQICQHLLRHDPGLRNAASVIYDGIDIERLTQNLRPPQDVKIELGIAPASFVVGMVGNIKEWKGQHVVVEAMRLMRAQGIDVHGVFVGSVSPEPVDQLYSRRLKHSIDEGGLDQKVTFTGFRKDVPDLINAVDVLIHASTRPEPFGRVILEGMALGKPVIATDQGGPQEIIEDASSGFLVPPQNATALADRLTQLQRSPEYRRAIGRRAVERVDHKFNAADTSRQIERLYSTLLGHPEAAA
jgi:glycosyltransferase involved in cell wall biosynthesis